MNEEFGLKFTIFFDDHSKTKEKLMKEWKMYDKLLHGDLKKILENLDLENIKLLDRYEPAISNLDETKQLRLDLSLFNSEKENKNKMIFTQGHSSSRESFTIDELKIICKKISKKLNEYLGYSVDTITAKIFMEIETFS